MTDLSRIKSYLEELDDHLYYAEAAYKEYLDRTKDTDAVKEKLVELCVKEGLHQCLRVDIQELKKLI